MKIHKHGFVKLLEVMGNDEEVENAARISYGEGTRKVSQTRNLIRYLMRHKHTSPFEMCEVKFHIKLPIFVMRQLVRHRTACIAGDQELYFDTPSSVKTGIRSRYNCKIQDLYNKWKFGCFGNENKDVDMSHIKLDEYYTPLQIGTWFYNRLDDVQTHIPYVMKKALNNQTIPHYLGSDIISYHDMIISEDRYNKKRKDIMKMHLRRCNEKTHEIEYTHITDMWQTGIKDVYSLTLDDGKTIKTTKDHLYFSDKGWDTLENVINLKTHKDNSVSSWKSDTKFAVNGILSYQNKTWLSNEVYTNELADDEIGTLANCSKHTIRKWREHLNYISSSLSGRIASNKLAIDWQSIRHIEYVGKEMTYDIEVNGPHHNFICEGFVVHNSINEYSGRYSLMSDEFYLPAEADVQEQSQSNNQGRGKDLDEDNKILVLGRMVAVTDQAKECYRQIANPTPLDGFYEGFKGIARELARTVLPVSNYTECIWKIDLNNFFHFAKLRMDAHAQKEIQDYASAMYELVKPKFPICCEAFEDYILNSKTFSAKEMRIIKENLNGSWVMAKYGLSERESKEFLDKLK